MASLPTATRTTATGMPNVLGPLASPPNGRKTDLRNHNAISLLVVLFCSVVRAAAARADTVQNLAIGISPQAVSGFCNQPAPPEAHAAVLPRLRSEAANSEPDGGLIATRLPPLYSPIFR